MTLSGLSPTIGQGQTVVITYTDPTAGDDAVAIEDAAGNETATFTTGVNMVAAVINNSTAVAGDTTPPTLTSAVVNESGLFVQLQFSENVDRSNVPPDTAVRVTVGGNAVTSSGVAVPPRTAGLDKYWVVVAPAIRQGEAVVVTYTDPSGGNDANAFQDTSGNDAASFTTGSGTVPGVTNGSTLTNNAPTAANGTVTTRPNTNYSFSAANFNFMDQDADSLSSVKIVTLPTTGTLLLSGTAIPSGELPKTVPATDLSAGRLKYAPPTGQSGSAVGSFTFRVNDGRADSSDAFTLTINVAQNTPPTSANNTVMTRQDTEYRFFISDFNYGDADGDWTGWNVKIVTLPSAGTLQNNTTSISAGHELHWTDIGNQGLKYVPPAGQSGAGLDSFSFKVNDRIADSTATYTMTVDVAASGSAQPETAHCTSDTNELWCATITVGDSDGLLRLRHSGHPWIHRTIQPVQPRLGHSAGRSPCVRR